MLVRPASARYRLRNASNFHRFLPQCHNCFVEPGEKINLIQAIRSSLLLKQDNWDDLDLVLDTFGFPISDQGNWGTMSSYITWSLQQGEDDRLKRLHDFVRAEVIDRPVGVEAQRRIWGDDGFRLFISHLASQASYLKQVKEGLASLGISAFIAHYDIKPSREWEDEILNALNSCEALAAVLHTGFHDSPWTDQEVGYALGRGLLVVPVMFGEPPKGFLNRFQAIRDAGALKPFELAVQLLDCLVGNEQTAGALAPHLVTRFEREQTGTRAESFLQRLERIRPLPESLLERLDRAQRTPSPLSTSEIRAKLEALFTERGYTSRAPAYDGLSEEPF